MHKRKDESKQASPQSTTELMFANHARYKIASVITCIAEGS